MASSALRLGPHLKELRVHLCQKSAASQGVRQFIEKHYVPMKKANPKFPILIRECSGISPKVWARYEYGRENCIELDDKGSEEVLGIINKLNTDMP